MAKQKLVMIGNGMAGLRTIEEILERSQSQNYVIQYFTEENDRRRYNYESL